MSDLVTPRVSAVLLRVAGRLEAEFPDVSIAVLVGAVQSARVTVALGSVDAASDAKYRSYEAHVEEAARAALLAHGADAVTGEAR